MTLPLIPVKKLHVEMVHNVKSYSKEDFSAVAQKALKAHSVTKISMTVLNSPAILEETVRILFTTTDVIVQTVLLESDVKKRLICAQMLLA